MILYGKKKSREEVRMERNYTKDKDEGRRRGALSREHLSTLVNPGDIEITIDESAEKVRSESPKLIRKVRFLPDINPDVSMSTSRHPISPLSSSHHDDMTAPDLPPPPNPSIIKKKGQSFPKIQTEEVNIKQIRALNNGKPHVDPRSMSRTERDLDPRSRSTSRAEVTSWATAAARTGLITRGQEETEKREHATFKAAGLITVAKQRMALAIEGK